MKTGQTQGRKKTYSQKKMKTEAKKKGGQVSKIIGGWG